MKIATWNVNSLKVRLPHVLAWLSSAQPDVLALQELKQENKNFPKKVFQNAGYYTAVNGQKTYNGVAFISKFPLEAIEMPDQDSQHRIISATIHGIRLINVYVPNGESVISAKYTYKLDWLSKFKLYLTAQLHQYPRLAVMGDFNIIPADEDAHDPAEWAGKVLFTALEKEMFQEILQLGLLDSFRLFDQPLKSFSWWDYRMMAFRRNRGLRIDHILISHALKAYCHGCHIDKVPRGWERPSDHTPVFAEFTRENFNENPCLQNQVPIV